VTAFWLSGTGAPAAVVNFLVFAIFISFLANRVKKKEKMELREKNHHG
jgi:hypothetical protein